MNSVKNKCVLCSVCNNHFSLIFIGKLAPLENRHICINRYIKVTILPKYWFFSTKRTTVCRAISNKLRLLCEGEPYYSVIPISYHAVKEFKN